MSEIIQCDECDDKATAVHGKENYNWYEVQWYSTTRVDDHMPLHFCSSACIADYFRGVEDRANNVQMEDRRGGGDRRKL